MLIINLKEEVSTYALDRMLSDLNMALKRGDKIHVMPAWAEVIKVNSGGSYIEVRMPAEWLRGEKE